jgi:hypothetical protein
VCAGAYAAIVGPGPPDADSRGRMESGNPLPLERKDMLETIIIILLILWALGYFAFNVGNLVHILLVIAIIVVLVRVIQGRKPF